MLIEYYIEDGHQFARVYDTRNSDKSVSWWLGGVGNCTSKESFYLNLIEQLTYEGRLPHE